MPELAPAADRRERRAPTEPDVLLTPPLVVDGTPRPFPGESSPPPRRATSGRNAPPTLLPTRETNSLFTVTGEAGMASPLGGDDIVVTTSTSVPVFAGLQVTSDGTIFLGVSAGFQFNVYRSIDGGETWPLWSTFPEHVSGFIVAEGVVDRALAVYIDAAGPDNVLRVAHADIHAGVPTWTSVAALSNAGVDHGYHSDFGTDAGDYPGYFVYVVSSSIDGNGNDIWFARSTNQGTSFEAGYRIASESTGFSNGYFTPLVGYGDDRWIHATYLDGPYDYGLIYRRVPMWGDGGLRPGKRQ
jgi:hypothetical protein